MNKQQLYDVVDIATGLVLLEDALRGVAYMWAVNHTLDLMGEDQYEDWMRDDTVFIQVPPRSRFDYHTIAQCQNQTCNGSCC